MTRFPIEIRSYPAGTTSYEPDGFRRIVADTDNRWSAMTKAFPQLGRFLTSSSLLIQAYPAALGISGLMPVVPHALHRPTFVRAIGSAVQEARPVVLAAQPLAGADRLLVAVDDGLEFPSEILWATGGYPLPRSLEGIVRQRLADRGCTLTILHCYGVGEIGHTCFAAIERDEAGDPIFRRLLPGLRIVDQPLTSDGESIQSVLVREDGRRAATGDRWRRLDDGWRLTCGPQRLDPDIEALLESWGEEEWLRRTGYLHVAETPSRKTYFQLRDTTEVSIGRCEMHYHDFAGRFGGTLDVKPTWGTGRKKTG